MYRKECLDVQLEDFLEKGMTVYSLHSCTLRMNVFFRIVIMNLTQLVQMPGEKKNSQDMESVYEILRKYGGGDQAQIYIHAEYF